MKNIFNKESVRLGRLYITEDRQVIIPFVISESCSQRKIYESIDSICRFAGKITDNQFVSSSYQAVNCYEDIISHKYYHLKSEFKNKLVLCIKIGRNLLSSNILDNIMVIPLVDFANNIHSEVIGYSENDIPYSAKDLDSVLDSLNKSK